LFCEFDFFLFLELKTEILKSIEKLALKFFHNTSLWGRNMRGKFLVYLEIQNDLDQLKELVISTLELFERNFDEIKDISL